MKELSIEEKAKAYDKAIEKIQKYVKDDFGCTRLRPENIFPELKEREEEECKKWILEYLYDGLQKSDEQFKGQFNAAIAWLEKKGEQKSQGKLEDDVRRRSTIQVLEYARSLDTYNQYGKADIDKNIAWLEKQGEHKPADKEYTFKAIPRLLGMIPPTDRAKSYCQKLIDSLEQEGYSTDAKIVRDCLKQMNGEKVAMATMDEQKPAWSEEDEKIVNLILCICSDFKKVYSQSETALKDADKIESFLESLKDRYTWKPSDEQMIALRQVISGCSYDIEPLLELETKLKEF